MRLEEYIAEFDTTPPKLARRAGISPLTVRNIMKQKVDVHLSIALSLEAATKGQVTCREMLPEMLLERVLKGEHLSPKHQKKKQKNNQNKKRA